ncbi:MAG: hypothetical protein R2878_05915 [Thermoleophilia bacterium]
MWAAARSVEDIKSLLAGFSAVVGLVDAATARLDGFGHMLTDGRVVALVRDVIAYPDA